ncbi:hypothetical protein SAMN04487910_2745 [Aquimarina amphilecti]|uniref:MORN repeat variant n=1 Tax=Aquimarina amphilecti TaxID=1038014 RepID=A0A1H7R1L4_AQUAM|nr:hypothetical protein [Aquimarina amphilecti]SEL53467.1 hypothetical protein SAMN04487910_2745 [Aquimarina amphilecti]
MKTVLKTIFLLTISFSCFSQNNGKKNLNLTFINQCTNEKISPEFEILMPELSSELNYEYITVYREIDDWIAQHTAVVKTKIDTIYIPKILFAGGNELHSQRWTYLNCEKVCNGIETDFYSNGNKRLEGKFENGKPKYIKYFRKDGIIENEELYKTGEFEPYRENDFDENGNLSEYITREKFKTKIVIKTFDKNDNLINKEIQPF